LTHNNPTMKAKFDDLPKGDSWFEYSNIQIFEFSN
jgi:hypothetical protein